MIKLVYRGLIIMIKKIKELLKKYETFIKYLFVAGISFIIDICLFNIFNKILTFNTKIILATIIARIISSFINYLLNNGIVFKSDERKLKTAIKYYILVVIQMFVSAFLVDNLYKLIKIDATFIKIPVELFLFICNYLIQKLFIFKRGNDGKDK